LENNTTAKGPCKRQAKKTQKEKRKREKFDSMISGKHHQKGKERTKAISKTRRERPVTPREGKSEWLGNSGDKRGSTKQGGVIANSGERKLNKGG